MYTTGSPFLYMFHIKFGFGWLSGFREEIFEYYGDIHVYYPGKGSDQPLW